MENGSTLLSQTQSHLLVAVDDGASPNQLLLSCSVGFGFRQLPGVECEWCSQSLTLTTLLSLFSPYPDLLCLSLLLHVTSTFSLFPVWRLKGKGLQLPFSVVFAVY